MAELPGADTEVDALPDRGWVWRCTDDSIEKGQVSVLSVLETFWALGLYGVLVWYFGHYWWLLITAFAAPVILLRSENSVELGAKLLWIYNHRGRHGNISLNRKIIIIILSTLFGIITCYWLTQNWLINNQGWVLFWRLGIIVAFTVATIATVTVSAAGAALIAQAFAAAKLRNTLGIISVLFFLPCIGAGVWLRTLVIRIVATLYYLIAGIQNIPLNWHQISWCLDFSDAPELLPRAGEVSDAFSVDGLRKREYGRANHALIIKSILIPIYYTPALIWRWSLKATLWLWWPLALSLKKPFQTETLPQIRDAIATIVAGWWKWLLMPIAIIIPWLLSGYFPEISSWVDIMPDQIDKPFDKLVNHAVPAPHSLRYAAIWLVCILSIVVWFKANAMKSQHPMIIGDETYIIQHDIENDPKYSELKQKFYHRAKGIARWHTWRIVSFILLGYSNILYLAYVWYPEQAGRVIPEWLIHYL